MWIVGGGGHVDKDCEQKVTGSVQYPQIQLKTQTSI